jgi:periplasmic copper chaperone A
MHRAGLLALVLACLVGCTVSDPTIDQLGEPLIRPENARVLRPAPAGSSAVVYVDVVNRGGADDTLVGVLSDVAGRAELRDRSGRLGKVSIPPASTVALASDGRHIELYDLKQPLRTGDVIIVTLLFEKSGAIGAITAVQ